MDLKSGSITDWLWDPKQEYESPWPYFPNMQNQDNEKTYSKQRTNLVCVRTLKLVPVPMGPVNVGYCPEIITHGKRQLRSFSQKKE